MAVCNEDHDLYARCMKNMENNKFLVSALNCTASTVGPVVAAWAHAYINRVCAAWWLCYYFSMSADVPQTAACIHIFADQSG